MRERTPPMTPQAMAERKIILAIAICPIIAISTEPVNSNMNAMNSTHASLAIVLLLINTPFPQQPIIHWQGYIVL